jgi:IS30 family transposase
VQRRLLKGTDPDIVPVRLALIEDNLNEMPRRQHNWQSPQTIYTDLSCNLQ